MAREWLVPAGVVDELFKQFDGYLARHGYIARSGQILDTFIASVPHIHNTPEGNGPINNGEMPEGWAEKPTGRHGGSVD